jgi:hypothetical protein
MGLYIRCPGCGQPVKWYHRKGGCFNTDWHRKCSYAYNQGYDTASHMSVTMSERYGFPTWIELSDLSQPQPQPEEIGLRKLERIRRLYPHLTFNKPDFWYTK